MRQVTSLQNPRVKLALQLHSKRAREREGLFLVEGRRELSRAADVAIQIFNLFICDEHLVRPDDRTLLDRLKANCVSSPLIVSPKVMDRMCYRSSEPILAICPTFQIELDRFEHIEHALYLVTAGFEKPGNLGSVLRSSDATGADGVLVTDPVTDIFNPNVVRSSLGTLFCVPVASCDGVQALAWCRNRSINVVATSPDAGNVYTSVDFTESTAIVVGSETSGLDEFWLNSADSVVSLPSLGRSDSLNASMTATVLLFEARRQRDLRSEDTPGRRERKH